MGTSAGNFFLATRPLYHTRIMTLSIQPNGFVSALHASRLDKGSAVFTDGEQWRYFTQPTEILEATSIGEVPALLETVEHAVASGQFAAGYVAYEAAAAFDAAFKTHESESAPLVHFGLYDTCFLENPPCRTDGGYHVGPWTPEWNEAEYTEAIQRIREYIRAGDTYQVNLTFPLKATYQGDSFALFQFLTAAQESCHAAYLNTGRHHIVSASPELFFMLDDDTITMRPMKGTRPRGRFPKEDLAMEQELAHSEKDRAENIMIVDLLRNDLARIAETGSVQVQSLFDTERYPTVWQLTSSIAAKTKATLPEIFTALFPCGSVTGAPKIRTMEIIHEIEPHPRGAYCGAIGWYGPNRQARFSVAIRTITVDAEASLATYPVGSGVTWYSDSAGEYQECLLKAAVLNVPVPEFDLLETLRYEDGYTLLEEHLQRLLASARYFGYPCQREDLERALEEQVQALPAYTPHRVRMCLARDGSLKVEARPSETPKVFRIAFAANPVDSRNVFLFHKTTHRIAYEEAAALRPDCDDVILSNERGEITESTIANVVAVIKGVHCTPPVTCGLLCGAQRALLLRNGDLVERKLAREDLLGAERVYLINSVRGVIAVEWAEDVE